MEKTYPQKSLVLLWEVWGTVAAGEASPGQGHAYSRPWGFRHLDPAWGQLLGPQSTLMKTPCHHTCRRDSPASAGQPAAPLSSKPVSLRPRLSAEHGDRGQKGLKNQGTHSMAFVCVPLVRDTEVTPTAQMKTKSQIWPNLRNHFDQLTVMQVSHDGIF